MNAQELFEHFSREEREIFPYLPAEARAMLVADHDRWRAMMRAGIMPTEADMAFHAAFEDSVEAQHVPRSILARHEQADTIHAQLAGQKGGCGCRIR